MKTIWSLWMKCCRLSGVSLSRNFSKTSKNLTKKRNSATASSSWFRMSIAVNLNPTRTPGGGSARWFKISCTSKKWRKITKKFWKKSTLFSTTRTKRHRKYSTPFSKASSTTIWTLSRSCNSRRYKRVTITTTLTNPWWLETWLGGPLRATPQH